MNCEECEQNISLYLDGEVGEQMSSDMRIHLTACQPCAKLCEDFSVILDSCRETVPSEIVPPNSQALWCRINNLIESEIKAEPPTVDEPPKSWLSRGWNLTFSQAGAGIL